MTKSPPNHHIPKELTISDQDLFEAVSRYGTPLYLYDAEAIIHRWKLLRSILPSQISIFYSVKANPNISVLPYTSSITSQNLALKILTTSPKNSSMLLLNCSLLSAP